MSSVVISGNTSGTITLDAPNVAGTTVLTLPTANGTVLTSASSLTASQLPSGSVLQVVQTTYTATLTTTSTTLANTSCTASITPSSASNKILVMTYNPGTGKGLGSLTNGNIALLRGATILEQVTRFALNDVTSLSNFITQAFNYLDNPATTSSVTYTVQYASGTSGQSAYFNVDGNLGTMTLMEIKG